jgi:hypothetical protein
MTLHGDETNARVAAVMRARAKPKKRRVGKKPTSGNSKLPSWYIRPNGSKP